MSLLSFFGKAESKLKAAKESIERDIEPQIEDAAEAAKKLLNGFESGATALFTKLADYESQLVDEIDSKTGILTDVRNALDKLRTIGVGPVPDVAQPAAAAADSAAPAPAPQPDGTGVAPAVPPVTAT